MDCLRPDVMASLVNKYRKQLKIFIVVIQINIKFIYTSIYPSPQSPIASFTTLNTPMKVWVESLNNYEMSILKWCASATRA